MGPGIVAEPKWRVQLKVCRNVTWQEHKTGITENIRLLDFQSVKLPCNEAARCSSCNAPVTGPSAAVLVLTPNPDFESHVSEAARINQAVLLLPSLLETSTVGSYTRPQGVLSVLIFICHRSLHKDVSL